VPVSLSATAADAQDASLPDSAFSWQVILVHRTHQHSFGTLTGPEIHFTPAVDHDADSHYEARLRVTDSGGLYGEATRRIDPETVRLQLLSTPPGAPLAYADTSMAAPFGLTSAIGFSTFVTAAESFERDGATYEFESWSDGRPRTHELTVPAEDTTLTADYTTGTSGDDQAPVSTAPNDAVPPGDAAPPFGPPQPAPSLSFAPPRSGIRVSRGGVLSLTFRNGGDAAWSGKLTVVAGHTKLVSRSFTVGPHAKRTLKVRLSRSARRLVARKRRLPAVVAIVAGAQTTSRRSKLIAPR
jgi:hypothetical protein